MPDFAERMQQLATECAAVGRDIAQIDVTVVHSPADSNALAQLAALGVNRVVLGLPTLNEADSLRWIQDNGKVVDWARQL